MFYDNSDVGTLSKTINDKAIPYLKFYFYTTREFLIMNNVFEKYKKSFYVGFLSAIIRITKGNFFHKIVKEIEQEVNNLQSVWSEEYEQSFFKK